MTYQLEINATQGYGADQAQAMSVGELINLLNDLEDTDQIVLHDETNRYGASFGGITGELNEVSEEE